MKYSVKAKSDNVHSFTFDCDYSDTIPTLVVSDVHYDSLKCDRKLLKKHLDEIKAKDGLIFIHGDWFDVMATYGDRRMKREQVDPRYVVRGRSYLDVVIEDSIEFLKPYAEHIALMSYGNHETTILKFHDTDPLRRLVANLNREGGNIQIGQYSGFVTFTGKYKKGTTQHRFTKQYHHGFGGNAKRSKGMLDVQIEVFKYPDADILVRGHDHMKWFDPSTTRIRLKESGEISKDNVFYLKTGSYKDGLGDMSQGWEVQKNFNPTRMGGWFVDYEFHRDDGFKPKVTEAQ